MPLWSLFVIILSYLTFINKPLRSSTFLYNKWNNQEVIHQKETILVFQSSAFERSIHLQTLQSSWDSSLMWLHSDSHQHRAGAWKQLPKKEAGEDRRVSLLLTPCSQSCFSSLNVKVATANSKVKKKSWVCHWGNYPDELYWGHKKGSIIMC